jgi:hypothetical protein
MANPNAMYHTCTFVVVGVICCPFDRQIAGARCESLLFRAPRSLGETAVFKTSFLNNQQHPHHQNTTKMRRIDHRIHFVVVVVSV